jgi:hypothetical protein
MRNPVDIDAPTASFSTRFRLATRAPLRWTLCGMWLCALASQPTLAGEQTTDATDVLPPELMTCYAIQRNSERLACYDRAVEYLRQPEEKLPAPSAETSFGLQGRAKDSRTAGSPSDPPAETTSITARVTNIESSRSGLMTISLDNGQVWRQISSSSPAFLNVGDEITINRAAFGSFLMRIPNGGPLRVRRVQ